MTTIAYRDGVLAADTLITAGNSRDGFCTKIAKRGAVLAAAAGSLPLACGFLAWFDCGLPAGREPKMQGAEKDDYAIGKIFTPTGIILTFSDCGWSLRRAPFYSFGSGADYAVGAMARGASAAEAVAVAIQFDVGTGGEIETLRHV